MPTGMRILIYYTVVLAFTHALLVVFSDTGILFGVLVQGLMARVINAAFFLVLVLIAVGFVRRDTRLYYLSLGVFFLSMANSFVTVLTFRALQESVLGPLAVILFPAIIVSIIMDGIVFWYLLERQEYFAGKKIRETYPDRVISYSIISIIVLFVLITAFTTVNFSIRVKDKIDNMMDMINSQSITESLFYCEGHSDKDLCYVALVTKHSETEDSSRLCERIDSGFYQFTCVQASK